MAFDEEKLIILVSQYPEIYDLQNEHYMNSTRKSNIWKEIADEMVVNVATCKEKWKSLRVSYLRNLKKRKCKSGDGASKNKKWKYELQMEFLKPYFQERATISNIENSEPITSDDNSNDKSLSEIMVISPEPPINSPQSSSSATSLMHKNITARKKKQSSSTNKLSVASVLQDYISSRPTTTTPTTIESGDATYSFFKAMADSVKDLPPDLQLNKIFAVISDLELENLLRNTKSSTEQTAIVNRQDRCTLDDTNEIIIEPTPSTSDLCNQLPPTTSKSPDHQFPNHDYCNQLPPTTSKSPDHQFPNHDYKSIIEKNNNEQKRYIITSDGFLIPQDVLYGYNE